jgi:hemoglobin
MTTPADEGGDPACWAHLFESPTSDIRGRSDIDRFVRDFYRQAAMDEMLGPIFAAAGMNWNAHIETLVEFWSWQLFGRRGYVGNPLRAHEPVNARTPFAAEHYERWLALFEDTIDTSFRGPVADLAKARAHKMALSMRRLLTGAAEMEQAEDAGDTPVEAVWMGRGGR